MTILALLVLLVVAAFTTPRFGRGLHNLTDEDRVRLGLCRQGEMKRDGKCVLLPASGAAADSPAALPHFWTVEFATSGRTRYDVVTGQPSNPALAQVGAYPTPEACEAAIPAVLKEQGDGTNGHCVEFDPKTGKLIRSQDPAFAKWERPR